MDFTESWWGSINNLQDTMTLGSQALYPFLQAGLWWVSTSQLPKNGGVNIELSTLGMKLYITILGIGKPPMSGDIVHPISPCNNCDYTIIMLGIYYLDNDIELIVIL